MALTKAPPGAAVTATEGLTTRRYRLPMADQHLSPIPLAAGGRVAVARIGDQYSIATDTAALVAVIYLARREARQLALALFDESQRELFEEGS
jgi:hypothetical protein